MKEGWIAVIDKDIDFQMYVSAFLKRRGYRVDGISSGDELLARSNAGDIPCLILLDLIMPEIDGIEMIKKIKAVRADIPIIMMSAAVVVRRVVEAMKLGASDFLIKPIDETVFETALENVFKREVAQNLFTKSNHTQDELAGFITVNPKMHRLVEITRRVAPTDVPILILGESGVGKEVLARYAHAHSGRATGPFIKVNCAALPDELLESELFGYERGAFTGAVTDHIGKFQQAHTGTILLDEIGEMSPHLQSKLLHVLQDGVFTRLGGRRPIQVDARIIASTNINIAHAIASGQFREDLYFRLNVVSLDLPPLRERREEIPALCNYFMSTYRDRYNPTSGELPADLLNRFLRYDWPGNIRQLENTIKRFLILPNCNAPVGERRFSRDVVTDQRRPVGGSSQRYSLLDVGATAADLAEQDLVRRVLEETHGNRKLAAKRMNICYKALLNKLKRWEVSSSHSQVVPAQREAA
jgi:two-component system, NtrC family, response regulator AtoC